MRLVLTVLWVSVALTVATGCAAAPTPDPSWQTIRAGDVFTFRAPDDMVEVQMIPAETFQGAYRSDQLQLWWDYGPNSESRVQSGDACDEYQRREIEVDGLPATLERCDASTGASTSVVIDVAPSTYLAMLIHASDAAADKPEAIVRSIDFAAADAQPSP